MFRHLSLVWDPANRMQCEAAQLLGRRLAGAEWYTAMDRGGLRVFCTGIRRGSEEIYLLQTGAGVVLGTVFESGGESSPPRKASFGPSETARILATEGRDLIASYWGQYIAFLAHPASGRKWILKDPTGGLPCFTTSYRGITVCFSHIEDCLRLKLLHFTVNLDWLATRVVTGPCRSESSALNEVTVVNSGECVEFESDRTTRRFYWDPREISSIEPIESEAEAAALMRATTRSCTHAWASCYDNVILQLSGGFDSSVVLAVLKDAPKRPRITCHTYYVPGTVAGDERRFAEIAARDAGCELVSQDRKAAALHLKELLTAPPSVNPPAHLSHLETAPRDNSLARARGAQVIFSGGGGDPLFARHMREIAVTDYVRRNGIRPELFRLARNLAPMAQQSIWRVLRDAMRNGRSRGGLALDAGVRSERELGTAEVQKAVRSRSDYIHPWFRPHPDVPPGKMLQIRLMLYTEAWFNDPLARPDDCGEVQPLRSQPLVELALRIPTYVQVGNGVERGLARRAFTQDLPAEILARRWKGRPCDLPDVHFAANLSFIREVLLDGLLVQNNLLDRQMLERTLSAPTRAAGGHLELFEHVITECWLRRWTNVRSETQSAASRNQ